MARNLPVGLHEVLKSGYAESHSTLELSLPSDIAPAINLYFATARLTIDGVTYDQQLRSADAVKTSLTRAADRVTVELQNVDTILGVDLLAVADTLYGANVQFGRYWKDLNSKATFHHILLTGAVAGVEINENVARLTLISDTYAAVSVGAKEQVIRTCRFQVQGEFRGTKCGYTGAKLTCNGLIDDADGCDGRHGDPLKRAKFGGFVYIEGKSSVAGAVALPIPASNQAIRTVATDLGSYASPVVQQPFLSVNEETFHVSNDATNEQTVITPKGIPTGFIHPVFDKGAATDGTTNVTTQLANAVADAENASLNYPPITLPPGTFTVSQLDLDSNVTIIGAGKGKTILKSTGANSAVLKITTGGNRVVLRGLTIEGTGAGSSQHGLEIVGSSPADIVVEDVDVTNVGGRAVYLNSPSSAIFSSVFKNITAVNWNMAATAGVPAFDIDTDGPCVLLENCYAKDTSSANAIGFRIRRGQTRTIKLESCNGIDPSGSGSIWAIVGQHTSLGDASTSVAYCTFSNCNVEAFTATGIEVRGSGSVINLIGANNFTAGGNGVRPIWFRSATIAGASPGIFDPQTIFANADTAATTYANGQAIESEGIPPLICLAPAGQFGSFSGWTTYWDTSLATDSTQPLRRLDALNRVAPTATYTIESQGTRLVDLRHSAPATVTLMYGGYMRPGEWVVIKDGGGVAATHNITVSAGGGSTIDGAGSVTLNTNYASLLVYSDGSNWLTWGGGGSSSGANTALSNLASVAINTSLLPGTDNAIDLGSSSKQWRRGYFGTAIVMANGATTVSGENWTITGGASPQYALSDGTVSARVQLLSGSYLQLGTTSNHNTLFLHNGTGVFTLRAVGLIPEMTNTYQLGGDSNRWTDIYLAGTLSISSRSDPGSPTNSDFWRSSTRGQLSIRNSGQTENLSATMWKSSASVFFDTTTTETSIISGTGVGTKTLAASRLVTGSQIRIKAAGLYGTKASSPGTFTVKVKNGATTMLTIAAFTVPTNVADQNWWIEATGALNATGSSGTIYWTINFYYNDGTGSLKTQTYAVNSTTINTTTTNALDVTGQFSVSDIANFWQTDTASIEII